jgi:RNA polymerase sigma-70 factor (ECF subfamily)
LKITATFEADDKLQQDLLQEILLSLWQALKQFKGESSLHTYVYRVAYNRALNHVAKQSRMPQHDLIEDSHICEKPSPDQSVKGEQRLNQLLFAIRQLPVMQRQLVTLSLDGLSYDDIAEITGLTSNNVGVKLNRAKKALKQTLTQHFGDNK